MRKSPGYKSIRPVLTVSAVVLLAGVAGLRAVPARAIELGPQEQVQDRDEMAPRGKRPRGDGRADVRPEGRAPEVRLPQPQGQPPAQGQPLPQGLMRSPEPRPPEVRAPMMRAPEARVPDSRVPEPRVAELRGSQRGGPDMRFAAPRREYRTPPPERIVPRLPPGYRQYYWGGSPYYHYSGHWYRPYGSSFMVVTAPFGMFVPYLPAYYSTVWVGGTRYYLADETYYVYDPMRRGYIVTRSPYDDERDEEVREAPAAAQELFVYPTRGQSESQQAEDRYQCHRWAADQSHYDPTESEYREAGRAEYDRAITACLTGRGYSVK